MSPLWQHTSCGQRPGPTLSGEMLSRTFATSRCGSCSPLTEQASLHRATLAESYTQFCLQAASLALAVHMTWDVPSAGGCKYALGWCFTTIICEQRPYLYWLQDRVLRAGVTLQQRSITSLQASALPLSSGSDRGQPAKGHS